MSMKCAPDEEPGVDPESACGDESRREALRIKIIEAKLSSLVAQTKASLSCASSVAIRLIDMFSGQIVNKKTKIIKTEKVPKILIINDDESTHSIARRSLENENIDVVTSLNPDCAQLIIQEEPDIILVDINMPDIKGRVVAGALTSNPGLVDGFVLLHSGIGEAQLKEMAEEYGAQGYIVKQTDPEVFVREIRLWLKIAIEKSLPI